MKRRTSGTPGSEHNESCLDMARRLGDAAGTPFEALPADEQVRLLREQLIREMPFLEALYEDGEQGGTKPPPRGRKRRSPRNPDSEGGGGGARGPRDDASGGA